MPRSPRPSALAVGGFIRRGSNAHSLRRPEPLPAGTLLRLAEWFMLCLALAGAMGCSMAWDSFIESQIFFPDKVLVADPGDLGLEFEDQWITTEDGIQLHAWWLPAKGAESVLVFFHGNAGNISHRLDNLRHLNAWGLSVLIFDYRGYGKSQGSISEKGLYADSRAAFEAGLARARDNGCRLALFGRSLGGVAAVSVAERPEAAGVILESTFTNLGDMAKVHFPLPGVGKLKNRFNSLGRIQSVSAPKLFIHGDRDNIVPFELGQRLYQEAKRPKTWLTLKGAGHNDTYDVGGKAYFQAIRSFLDRLP